MHINVVAPPGECLRVKTDMVSFAGYMYDPYPSALKAFAKTRYKSMLPLPLPVLNFVCGVFGYDI